MNPDDPKAPSPAAPRRRGLSILPTAPAGEIDPVCGMSVDPNAGKPSAEHGGKTFWFCSNGCKAKFEADPAKYLAGHREPMGHGGPRAGQGHAGTPTPRFPQPPRRSRPWRRRRSIPSAA